jgi:hypothetical protein
MVRIRCSNKIMEMQEARYNERMKWNSEKLEDAVISHKFKHDNDKKISETGRVLRYTPGMESHKNVYW